MAMMDRLAGRIHPPLALRRAIRLAEAGKPAEAFRLMATAARAGIPEAQYRVARCYLEGSGVPPSRLEGARWLRRAADGGNADAQALLAALYTTGLAENEDTAAPVSSESMFNSQPSQKPDFETALPLAQKAAEAGSATGQAILGYILSKGPKTIRDLDTAHFWYEKSAAAGCPEGCLGLAVSLIRRKQPEHRTRIAEALRRAADAGLPTAIYLLAALTERGMGVPVDLESAAELYQLAAEKGLASAQFRLGLSLIEGTLSRQDPAAGEAWLRRAALAGNRDACYQLAELYMKRPQPDYVESAAWYRRAAEAGHQVAARSLASLYLSGNGVALDVDEGKRWLRVAANGGNRESQVDLANLVLEGGGDRTDDVDAAEWFGANASSGDAIAAFNLGLCFSEGIGVRKDQEQAAMWMRRAAEGMAQAQYMYARMLQDGRGMVADQKQARVWFERAAKTGMADAQVALGEMLYNGRGGECSPVAAARLFKQAAAAGHVGAMYAIGALYESGQGLSLDRKAAQKWFAAAAERGHGHAQLMLGRYLCKGIAGEHDPVAGRMWLKRAAAQGLDEAANEVGDFERG
ncbi:tetratricopeptide repeat protein [Mesorhizobium sp. BH1-1-4]|uniref:tetratricopeptide repeat protein n=1 Tax=Mesorhizobium sp. BH1-1-4 TaxID=2876662 RepID=UPI001CD07AF1|nr:tetratricopeptide repeat protein [Mesorhizobium sp. BH1-1-4]MBZ9993114.1 sel1 repeat family protein [Mesorhizobium sp. BH1-1-4]